MAHRDELDDLTGKLGLRPLPILGQPEAEKDRQEKRPGGAGEPDEEPETDEVVAPGRALPLPRLRRRFVVSSRAENLAPRAPQEGVVDGEQDRLPVRDGRGEGEVEEQEAEGVHRPAGTGEEAVRAGVVPDAGTPGRDEAAGDRVAADTGEEIMTLF